MQFKYGGRAVEKALANFYLVENAWFDAAANSFRQGLSGPNLAGCCVSWVRDPSLQALIPEGNYGAGASIGAKTLGSGADDSCQDMVLGILETNMVVGKDPLINTWVSVVTYGFTSRIAVGSALAANDDYLVMQETGQIGGAFATRNWGFTVGYKRPAARAPRRLIGRCFITLVTPADGELIEINLDGSGTTQNGGTTVWSVVPGKANDQATSADASAFPVPKGDACVVAFRTSKAAAVPPETVAGGSGIPFVCEGFVTCLGMQKSVG